jgi:outer membrane protein assembly factor BamB
MKATVSALTALTSVVLFLGSLSAADWPGFRGPSGVGVSYDQHLPVQWSADNVLWKVKLPGLGTSSPILSNDKVFLTTYTGYGTSLSKGMGGKRGGGKGGKGKGATETGDQKDLRLHVLCLDAQDGHKLWQKDVEPKLPEAPFGGFLREHGYASSTPVTDGKRVYVFFGKSGVLAFDLAGKQLWQTDVGSGTDKWGSASSPVLFKDLVIVNAAIESKSLVGLDRKTGTEVWRTPGIGKCWTSPLLVETKDGKHELVLSLPGKVVGYDPETGKELWHCQGIGTGGFGYTTATPVARDGVVYASGGGGPTPMTTLAVRAGGRGDVNASHVLWRQKVGSGICSPVLSGDFLCWVAGTATCLRADTGKLVYKETLYDGRGEYVSPVAAGDKIFALTRFDGLFVLAGGEKFQQLAHNQFEGDKSVFNASPAVSNERLYIRSNEYLYCVGKK